MKLGLREFITVRGIERVKCTHLCVVTGALGGTVYPSKIYKIPKDKLLSKLAHAIGIFHHSSRLSKCLSK